MKIGIIGAGNIGGNLTRAFTQAGHDVRVANSRGPETLAELAKETGATAVSAGEAAEGADVVVVTIPQKSVPDLPANVLAGASPDVVVVDTNNYYPQQRDGRIDAIESGTPRERLGGRATRSPGREVLQRHPGSPAADRRSAVGVRGTARAARGG